MAIKAFKVDTETLTLIDRYLEAHPEGQRKIEEAFAKCITTLNETDSGKHSMLEESSVVLLVKPKKEFKKIVTKKYGKKGPYKVSKQIKSFTHTGDGFYSFEGSESIYPADWFQPAQDQTVTSNYLPYVFAIIWGISLFSGGYAFGILQSSYIFMLLPF